jgi:flagellar FliJ protein
LRKRIEDLEKGIAVERERLCRADRLEAAERWLSQSYMNALREDEARCRLDLKGAEDFVDQCRADLVEKAKNRGLLDSLKEKQAARHFLLERQQEQRTNDETATLRYTPVSV